MSGHKSKKKGSNIICRVSNATPEMVCNYVSRLPKQKMSEREFRRYMGEKWFQNEHQAPEQWGLYYIDGLNYYPRFNREISMTEAKLYLYGWIKRLIVINPYTRFKATNDNRLVESIVRQLEINPNEHDLKNIIRNIINTDEPFVINEIIANVINSYSEVLSVKSIDKDNEKFEVSLLPNYKEIIKRKYKMNKKDYFDLFSDIKLTNHQDDPKQQIFYGAPGTGKSHEIKEKTKGESVIRTTFHPDSDYSTFVGAYKPTMDNVEAKVVPVVLGESGTVFNKNEGTYQEKRIVYQFVMQAFLKAYLSAWKKYAEAIGDEVDPQFLIIEEINRGNCAQIFGDLFQLLDRGDNGFSEYPIEADNDLQREIERAFMEHKDYKLKEGVKINVEGVLEDYTSNYGATLSEDIQSGRVLLLTPNLYIWATMNTSDQSLFPIDSAFKRRWDWKYMKIAEGRDSETKKPLNWVVKFDYEEDGKPYTFECSWWQFILAINEKIANATSSDDKKLGYFFCKPKTQGSKEIDAERFVGKVVFYLWNDVFKDEDNAIFKVIEGNGEPSFDAFYTENEEGKTVADTVILRKFMHNVFREQSELYTETAKKTTDTAETVTE